MDGNEDDILFVLQVFILVRLSAQAQDDSIFQKSTRTSYRCLLWEIITSKNYFPCLLLEAGTLGKVSGTNFRGIKLDNLVPDYVRFVT